MILSIVRYIHNFHGDTLGKETSWNPGIGRKIRLKCIFKGGDWDWIDLAHDRKRWHVLVNMVMKLSVP